MIHDAKPPLGEAMLVHSSDFNLEEEYGWFLEGILTYVEDNPDEFLEHYGVKGMKWGVQKRDSSSPRVTGLGPDSVTAKTKSGETITMTKRSPPLIARALSRVSPKYLEQANNYASLSISDSKGNKIGDAQVTKVGKDELNLIWLGINKSSRGQGYATAAMKTAVNFGRESGVKKITLEVPGNAPDARHIYEKLGFKATRELPTEPGDSWGGLTVMEYPITPRVRHNDVDLSGDFAADFLKHYGMKGMKWGTRKVRADEAERKARFGPKSNKSDNEGPDKYGFVAKARGTSNSSRPVSPSVPTKSKKSHGKKIAVGALAVAGAAAAAYVISQGGNVPTRAIGPVVSNPRTVSAVRSVTSSPAFRSTINDLDSVTASLIGNTDRMLGR